VGRLDFDGWIGCEERFAKCRQRGIGTSLRFDRGGRSSRGSGTSFPRESFVQHWSIDLWQIFAKHQMSRRRQAPRASLVECCWRHWVIAIGIAWWKRAFDNADQWTLICSLSCSCDEKQIFFRQPLGFEGF